MFDANGEFAATGRFGLFRVLPMNEPRFPILDIGRIRSGCDRRTAAGFGSWNGFGPRLGHTLPAVRQDGVINLAGFLGGLAPGPGNQGEGLPFAEELNLDRPAFDFDSFVQVGESVFEQSFPPITRRQLGGRL